MTKGHTAPSVGPRAGILQSARATVLISRSSIRAAPRREHVGVTAIRSLDDGAQRHRMPEHVAENDSSLPTGPWPRVATPDGLRRPPSCPSRRPRCWPRTSGPVELELVRGDPLELPNNAFEDVSLPVSATRASPGRCRRRGTANPVRVNASPTRHPVRIASGESQSQHE